MATINHLISSFNAGELTPEMDRRLGVEKVASGCRILENFIPRVHGPVFRRPGLVMLGEATSSLEGEKSRLLSFNFSTTTSFVLELSAGACRVWSNGVLVPLVTPISLPFLESELFEVQVRQVNDIVYMVHRNHAPHKLVRRSDTLWESAPVFSLGVNTVSTGVTTGAAGECSEETWATPNSTFPTTAAGMRDILNLPIFQSAPSSTLTKTSVTFTTSGAAPILRRIQCKFTVPTTGVWKFWTGPNDAGLVLFLNGMFIVGTASQFGVEVTALTNLTAGKEYKLVAVWWNNAANAAAALNLSGPAVAKAPIPAAYISTLDTVASVTTREQIRQYPPMLSENVGPITLTPSATSGAITLTASADLFQQGHEGAYFEIAHRREVSSVEIVGAGGSVAPGTAFSGTTTALRVIGGWDFYTYGTWSGTIHLERLGAAGTWEIVRSWVGALDRNVIQSGTEEQESHLRLRAVDCRGVAASGAAVPRFLLEAADAQITGLVRITDVTNPTTAAADVVLSLHATDATAIWTEGAFSALRGYPRAVTLHQQRLLFAGTSSYPVGIWGSVANDIENFRRTTLDDGSFFFQLASDEANIIQWLTSYSRLLIGTSGELWSADGGGTDSALNATSVRFVQGGRFGSAYLGAVLVHEVPVFVERTGRKVRRVTYSQEEDKFIGANLTVLAEHVTAGGVTQLAFQQQPNAILWTITATGELVGMTWENEQNVYAWHRHVTAGTFESVAVVYGTDADELWVSVLREINGVSKRFIERLDPTAMAMDFSDPAKLVHSDCASVILPAGEQVVSVPHLAGESVTVLADGAVLEPRVVSEAGEIDLERADVGTAIIGLAYTSTLQPWRQEWQLAKGTAQGSRVKVANVTVMLYESMAGEVLDDPNGRAARIDYRTAGALMNTAIPLFTGEKFVKPASNHRENVDVVVRTAEPLPLNVTGLVLKLDPYDS